MTRESQTCEVCESLDPAWSYQVGLDGWLICEECHRLIQKRDRRGLAERALGAEMAATDLEFLPSATADQLAFLEDALLWFWDNVTAEPEPLTLEGFPTYHRTVVFFTREALARAAQTVLDLAGKLDLSVDISGRRLDENRWELEVKAPKPVARVASRLNRILAVRAPAA